MKKLVLTVMAACALIGCSHTPRVKLEDKGNYSKECRFAKYDFFGRKEMCYCLYNMSTKDNYDILAYMPTREENCKNDRTIWHLTEKEVNDDTGEWLLLYH